MPTPTIQSDSSTNPLDREIATTVAEADDLEKKLARCRRHLAELRLTRAEQIV